MCDPTSRFERGPSKGFEGAEEYLEEQKKDREEKDCLERLKAIQEKLNGPLYVGEDMTKSVVQMRIDRLEETARELLVLVQDVITDERKRRGH